MPRIHKFVLPPQSDEVRVKMPAFSRPLSVAFQRDQLVLWVLVHPAATDVEEIFQVYKTGENFDETLQHQFIGTAMTDDGAYVAHVYWISSSRQG